MIVDAKLGTWQERYFPTYPPLNPSPMPTQAEIDEFRRLLERAREYDKQHGEPDCELEEKRQRIKELADKLGVKVEFV
jgi:hypothetical protein